MAGLVLDLLQQGLLGLSRAQAGDALERALVLAAQLGQLLLLGREPLDVRLEVALARVELGRPPIQRVLERAGALGGARLGGGGLAVPEVGGGRGVGVPAVGLFGLCNASMIISSGTLVLRVPNPTRYPSPGLAAANSG